MTERFIKITVLFITIACALCFSEVLIAATSTGSLAISAIVLSRCIIRFSMGGVAPQSTCDDGMKAAVTIEASSEGMQPKLQINNADAADTKSVVTLTY